MPSSNTDLQTILFLTANPRDTGRLRLEQELRDIAEGLQRAQKRDQFKLELRLAVRPRDVQRAMLDVNPQIIHFSGHGTGEQGLVFEDDLGNAKLVSGDALAGLFKLFADRVNCVVLNGCYSKAQANEIAKHIPYVIGMNQAIGDKAAITFAVGFYDALGAGRSIEFAYNFGCTAIQMEGIAEHLTPVLLKQFTNGDATLLTQSCTLSLNPPVLDAPKSSNLRIRRTFSDRDRDTFLGESFEYIANFFENSLNELSSYNPEVNGLFKRIDANRFTAVVYTSGKAVTECCISLGGSVFLRGNNTILYSPNASGNHNGFNESMSIVDDGYALFLQPLGISILGSRQDAKKMLLQQDTAEYFWNMLIKRLQ